MLFQLGYKQNERLQNNDQIQVGKTAGTCTLEWGRSIILDGKSVTSDSFVSSVKFEDSIIAIAGKKTSEVIYSPGFDGSGYAYKIEGTDKYKSVPNSYSFYFGDSNVPSGMQYPNVFANVGTGLIFLATDYATHPGKFIVNEVPVKRVYIATKNEGVNGKFGIHHNVPGTVVYETQDGIMHWADPGTKIYFSDTATTKVVDYLGTPKLRAAMEIYPNPAFDHATVRVKVQPTDRHATIYITDSAGKTQIIDMNLSGREELKMDLDLRSYSSGPYFISIQTQSGIVGYGQAVKQ